LIEATFSASLFRSPDSFREARFLAGLGRRFVASR
jgi:hypothetical protein